MPDSVHQLDTDSWYRFFARVLEFSSEARTVHEEMLRQGLEAQSERTQLFSTFSQDSLQSIAISVTPYTTRDLTREGGLSISQGGHAQGVIVDIQNRTEIIGFTHLATLDGELVSSTHTVDELSAGRPQDVTPDEFIKARAEEVGKVRAARSLVEIEPRQVRSLASISFNTLLGDDLSRSVHDDEEITRLRAATGIINEIGLFVLFRTQGSACCSCSCSCWGSSSCSCSYVG